MVAWTDLLLPILISAVLVFVASSLIHMVLQWHNPDYRSLSNEDEVRAAIKRGMPATGQYIFPHCLDGKRMNEPAMKQKFIDGPIGVMYIRDNGAPELGPFLLKWVLYTIIVGALAGYVARSTLAPNTAYLKVFQVVGASAWLAYAWQGPSDSIWKGKPWVVTFRGMLDGLIYAALTAGTFAWLWPH